MFLQVCVLIVALASAVPAIADIGIGGPPSSLAPVPRSVLPAEAKVPNDTVVRICYTHDPMIKKGCEALNKYLRQCGLNVMYLENPSLDDIRTKLKGLKPNTNVLVGAHGLTHYPDKDGTIREGHHIAVTDNVGFRPEDRREGARVQLAAEEPQVERIQVLGAEIVLEREVKKKRTNLLSTKELLAAVDESLAKGEIIPSKYLGACHSGLACTPDARCTGAACAANERSWALDEYMEDQERVLAYMMCFPAAFRRIDEAGNKNGVLDGDELTAYFKQHGLPREEVAGVVAKQTIQLKNYVLYPTSPKPVTGAFRLAIPAFALGDGHR